MRQRHSLSNSTALCSPHVSVFPADIGRPSAGVGSFLQEIAAQESEGTTFANSYPRSHGQDPPYPDLAGFGHERNVMKLFFATIALTSISLTGLALTGCDQNEPVTPAVPSNTTAPPVDSGAPRTATPEVSPAPSSVGPGTVTPSTMPTTAPGGGMQ
jgi:hypothetical protein